MQTLSQSWGSSHQECLHDVGDPFKTMRIQAVCAIDRIPQPLPLKRETGTGRCGCSRYKGIGKRKEREFQGGERKGGGGGLSTVVGHTGCSSDDQESGQADHQTQQACQGNGTDSLWS